MSTPKVELDALVAEKVFGARVWFREDLGKHIMTRCSPHRELPEFSSDISAAWQVVERIQDREPAWRFDLIGGDRKDGRAFGWHASFFGHADPSQDYGQRHGEAYADTAPLAICLAALKAVGVEVGSAAGQGEA